MAIVAQKYAIKDPIFSSLASNSLQGSTTAVRTLLSIVYYFQTFPLLYLNAINQQKWFLH